MEPGQKEYWWSGVDLRSSRKKLPQNIAKVIAKWSLEHDQIKKTDCGKKGEDALKNWDLLMDLIDISKCEDKDQKQALDKMIKNHVYNCGLQYSNNGVYEDREVFILDDDDELDPGPTKRRELERGVERVWAPWTKRWFSSSWDGDTKPPQSVTKKEPPLYLTARGAIRKALPHLTEEHKQLLIELINEKPRMPSISSENDEGLSIHRQLKRTYEDIGTWPETLANVMNELELTTA